MYLYLCTSKMDENTAMESSGTKFAIQLFNKLFYDKNTAEVVPGHYTMARNFKRETFYPGTEIDYMGMTIPFGFYVQEYCPGMFADSNYGYSYVTDGTVDIERDSDGKYTIVVDGISSYGHTIKCTFEGTDIPVKDMSDDDKKSSLSTLEDDVVTDLSQIKVARLYYNGVKAPMKTAIRLFSTSARHPAKTSPLLITADRSCVSNSCRNSDSLICLKGLTP